MFPWHSKKYKTPEISEQRKQELKQHSQRYHIPITNYSLWELALMHISCINTKNSFSYERLEFLGDSVLGLCLADILFTDFPELSEGKMSTLKSGLVNEKTLSELANQLDLLKIVQLGKGERLKDKRAQEKVLCDLFESTLAVIFLQYGFKKSREFVNMMMATKIFSAITEGIDDSKTKLQKIAIKFYKEYPTYTIVDTEGPDHGKIFVVKGMVTSFEALARGRSKKEAEQNAAYMILQQMTEYSILHKNDVLAKELAQHN
ncbi:MAG: ribonuclease III [Brevinema sp.]